MVLLVDNYDSFVYNLARFLEELGERAEVVRNDALDPDRVAAREPSHVVLSPGPCTPAEAGVSVPLIRALGARLPILGVCLGHQCLAEAYGGRVVRAARPMHGRLSAVRHEGTGLFAGLPTPLTVTRYHSLVVDPRALGDGLRATAWTDDGEVMALRHVSHPVWGVQFHPEALLSEGGHRLLANFLALGRGEPPDRVDAPASSPELEQLTPPAT